MTENKRFVNIKDEIHLNGEWWCSANGEHCADVITTALNELLDENEQLKQFKEDVFNKIDMHLRMLPTARDNEFNEDDGDPSLYVGAIYMLETLKKELEE